MAVGLLKRAPSLPDLTPERRAVAGAQAAAHAEAAERAAAEAAMQPAIAAVWAAQRAVEVAEGDLAAARSQCAGDAATALMDGAPATPVSLRAARNALLDAEDALDVSRAVRAEVESRLARANEKWAGEKLDKAITTVIATEGAARAKWLAGELTRLQREMMAAADELRWLVANGAVPVVDTPGFSFGRPLDPDLASALTRLEVVNPKWDALIGEPAPRRRWINAMAALQTDATTPLPSTGEK